MSKEKAMECIKFLKDYFESGAEEIKKEAESASLSCNKSAVQRKVYDSEARESSVLVFFQQLTSAITPELPLEKSDDRQEKIANALFGAAAATRTFIDELVVLGSDEFGARSDFCLRLSEKLNVAFDALQAAGTYCASDNRPNPKFDAEGLSRTIGGAFTECAFLLTRNRIDPTMHDQFFRYGETFGRVATHLSTMVSTLPQFRKTDELPPELLFHLVTSGNVLRSIILASLYEPLSGERIVEGQDEECPSECPYKGCTTYCRDYYNSIVSHTPAWWQRVVGGVGGPTGIYHLTCRWSVTRRKKIVCACYRSRWDRFWASNECKKWVFIVESTRIETYNHFKASLGVPSELPGPFWLWC